jgi:site-specific DNA-methyltransferase (adenine-specific)
MKEYVVHADCHEWLEDQPENTYHAIVTDPPYGFKEYTAEELGKLRNGKGGVWRLPPTFDGVTRSPLPRFTVLSKEDLARIEEKIGRWAKLALPVLRPGGHVFLASNSFVSPWVARAMIDAGFERRGEVIRLLRGIRGGYRPKGAEEEFHDTSTIPRSCYEPWGIYRKPMNGERVADTLRKWETGALQRTPEGNPFPDVLRSGFPTARERAISDHPTLKPQRFLRQMVWTALPLGKGKVVDCFAGSGSTIAAALALGPTYEAIGVEIDTEFAKKANEAVPLLAKVEVEWRDFNGVHPRKTKPVTDRRQKRL